MNPPTNSNYPQPPLQQPMPSRPMQQTPAVQLQPRPMPSGFAFATGAPNKVHHSYIWLSTLVGVGLAFLIGIMSSVDDVVSGLAFAGERGFPLLIVFLLVVVAFVLLYGIFVGVAALAYKHLSYVFDEKEFSLYSGILSKKRVHVPYSRVQSVNHRQSLIQRIAGVCTVEIDTAGGASNKAVKVPYVKLDVGEAIRTELFARKAAVLGVARPQGVAAVQQASSQAVAAAADQNVVDDMAAGLGVDDFRGLYGGAFAGMEPVSFERRLANKELLLASISSSGVSATLVSLLVTIAVAVAGLASVAGELAFLSVLAVPLIILVFLVGLALSVATTALSYGSFSVRRRGSRIEVERGILQRDFSGIDIDRIQSLVVRQSFIRRLLGYCEVSVGRVRAGSGEEQKTQASLNAGALVVHPFLKLDQVSELLAGLLPEFADRPATAEFKRLPPVAMRRGIIRRCIVRNGMFWTTLLVAIGQVVFNVLARGFFPELSDASLGVNAACVAFYVAFALSLVASVLGTVWWKQGSGFALNQRFAALYNDGLSTEAVYVPRSKIQDSFTRTNPFQKRAGTTTIGLRTAAGTSSTHAGLWDVTAEDGQAWLAWLKPRTSVVE